MTVFQSKATRFYSHFGRCHFKKFLSFSQVHPLAAETRFQKRIQNNPVEHKPGATETGKIKYDGLEFEDDDSSGFLADKVEWKLMGFSNV